MARRTVVEIQCDRCTRKEYREDSKEEAFYTQLGEESVVFSDLCTPCRRTVKKYFDAICKKIEGVSPDRKAAPESGMDVDLVEKTADNEAEESRWARAIGEN